MTTSINLAIVKHPNTSFEIKVVGLYGGAWLSARLGSGEGLLRCWDRDGLSYNLNSSVSIASLLFRGYILKNNNYDNCAFRNCNDFLTESVFEPFDRSLLFGHKLQILRHSQIHRRAISTVNILYLECYKLVLSFSWDSSAIGRDVSVNQPHDRVAP